MKKIALIAFVGLMPLSAVYAQKDSTLNRTVVVENEYNPDIMDASKINVLPKVEEPAVAKKGIEYATALRPVLEWNYEEMSPIMREWMANNAKRGYLRAGYGSHGNVDFKAGYLWDLSPNDRLQVAASLDGMNGTLDNWTGNDWKSRFYASDFRLDYRHSFSRMDFKVGANLGSQVFNYMPSNGWNADPAAPSTLTDKQHYALGNVHLGLASTDETMPLQFAVEAGFNYFNRKYPLDFVEKGNEKDLYLKGEVWGKISEEQRVGIRFDMDNLSYTSDSLKSYTSLCLNPYYALHEDQWRLRIGAHVDWQSGNGGGFDLAPDIKAEYIFSDSYVFYLHAQGGRELNDFRRLNAISPYFSFTAQLPSTYVPLDATIGFKASPVGGLWFNLFGGYRISEDEIACGMPYEGLYYYAYLLQDKTKTAYVGAEVKYGYKDYVDVRLKGVYNNWKATDKYLDQDFFLATKPAFELNFGVDVKVMTKLRANLAYEYVKRVGYTPSGSSQENGLATINNLSVGATYELLNDLSIFARVNNVLNKQYYYAYGYPAEKLNVLGGVLFRF